MKFHKLTTITLLVLTLVRGFETSAQDNHWLSYGPAVVELEGKLIAEFRYGPPNFGENPKTDAKLRVPILMLTRPINVRGNPQDPLNAESVVRIRRIQVILLGAEDVAIPYKQFIGKKLRVKGTLVHAHTGYHFTKVVMLVRSVEVERSR